MPARPKKPKTLAQIMAEGKAFRAAAMPVARGSGFDKLSQKNNAFDNGTTRKDEKPYPPVVKKAVKVVCIHQVPPHKSKHS